MHESYTRALTVEIPLLRSQLRSAYDGVDVELEELVLSNRPVRGL